MKKTFLSLMLALVMCISLLPAAYAADTKWTGIVSDQNMTFDDTAAILADGTLKAWYAVELDGKIVTAKRYELTAVGSGYKAIAAPNLLKEDGKLAALDNPALYSEIFFPGIDNVAQVSTEYSVVLKNDGTVWSYNEKLADGVKQIAVGDHALFLLKNDGSLWSKGFGGTAPAVNPALGRDQGRNSGALGKVMDNVAYAADGIAIQTDGSLWSWGEQWTVGNGAGQASASPVRLLNNAVGAWSNGNQRFALTADGSLYSWGLGSGWALGYEKPDSTDVWIERYDDLDWQAEHTVYYQSKPRKVDIDGAVSVYSGQDVLLVQKSDGSLWAIGNVGSLPCRTGAGGEKEISTSFRKVMDGVKLSPKVAAAKAAPAQNPNTQPAQPSQSDVPGTSAKGKLVTGSLDMPQLSKQEIIDLLAANPATFSGQVYDSQPSCFAPYAAGKLSDAALQAALNRLNALRRIVGMPAAQLNKSWCESAQYGAVILGQMGSLSHPPSKPADMSKDFYDKAYAATYSSNLSAGSGVAGAVDSLMRDHTAQNITSVGHRRWQLSPALSKVGFGYVDNGGGYGKFFDEKVFDRDEGFSVAHSVNYDSFGWPSAGYFPNDLNGFTADCPWTVSLNPDIYAVPKGIAVKISGGGKNWTLSGSYTPADAGAYLGITPADNWNYGGNHCIAFRPNGVKKYEGAYTVEIQGLKSKKDNSPIPFTYQVEFFSTSQPVSSGAEEKPAAPSKPADQTAPTTPAAPTPAAPFADVPAGAYYTDAVLWAYQNNITSGATATTFEPYSPCTRGQVATFLWRAQGEPEPKTTVNPFRDVKASDYYYKAVLWAYENGITSGTTSTAFSPKDTCTNGHVVTFLWRANHEPSPVGTSSLAGQFKTSYYTSAVAWADTTGLLKDTGAAFDPSGMSPRANIVTYLYRNLSK